VNDQGQQAEARAAVYLEGKGLRIIARNWRCRFGEIDLVAKDGKLLVFVEVRSRSSRSHGGAAESISIAKRRKLTAAASLYLTRAGADTPCRFDALLIEAEGNIEWIRDAFSAT
jgi:putative endonuclease